MAQMVNEKDTELNGTIKMEIRKIINNFSNETTMHGVSKTLNKSYLHKVIWGAFLLCMMILTLMFIYNTVIEYIKFNTVVNISKKPVNSLEFPAISLCNVGTMHKQRTEEYFLNKSKGDVEIYNSLYKFINGESFNHTENVLEAMKTIILADMFRNTSQKIDHLGSTCQTPKDGFFNFDYDCYKRFDGFLTDAGYCYTFNSKLDTSLNQTNSIIHVNQRGMLGSISMLLNVDIDNYFITSSYGYGVQIKIHDPYTFPSFDAQMRWLKPGEDYKIEIKKTVTKRIGEPYLNQKCIDQYDYSQDLCMTKCFTDTVYDCNCSYIGFDEDGCTLYDYNTCAVGIVYDFTASNIEHCSCFPKCIEPSFEVTITSLPFFDTTLNRLKPVFPQVENITHFKNNYLHFKIFYEAMDYTEIEHVPAMSLGQLVSNIGGQLGLFLGASVLTILECLELILLIVHNILQKKIVVRKKGTNI